MSDPLLEPLRSLLDRQIQRSTPAREAARELEGRTLAIRLRNTVLTLFMTVTDGRLSLSRQYDRDPDALLESTPLGLAELARGRASSGRIAMAGDPVVAQHFERLLRHTQPDWEEELSRIVGDVAAHQVGNAVRGLLAFGQRAAQSLTRSSAEYLQEERRDVPAPDEVHAFGAGVDEVAARVDELVRRFERLEPKARE